MESHRQDSPMPDRPPTNESLPIPTPPPAPAQLESTRASLDSSEDEVATDAFAPEDPSEDYSSSVDFSNPSESSRHSQASSSSSSTSSEAQKDCSAQSVPGWFPIPEDTSLADANEISRIEASGTESNALEESNWTRKFASFTDPEYVINEQGKIDWVVSPFNGTHKNPQKDHMLASSPVLIGGYSWQLKVFPKGYEGPYLAISLECRPQDQVVDSSISKSEISTNAQALQPAVEQSRSSTGSWRIATQFEIVVYNPQEPRVNFSKGSQQAFSAKYPTCSFKRFAPVNIVDIGLRLPGQRQALLRNDQLGIVAYIRTYHDDTGCLFLRQSDPGESFFITGLRGIQPTNHRGSYGQGLLAALTCWIYLPPIRRIVKQMRIAVDESPVWFSHHARLACALNFVCNFVSWSVPGSDSHARLCHIEKALEWHGTILPDSADVFEVLELFRKILVREADSLCMESIKEDIRRLGTSRLNLRFGLKNFGKDVQGLLSSTNVESVEEDDVFKDMINKVILEKPVILPVQFPRQRFDREQRRWKKSRRHFELAEELDMASVKYKLYALVTHDHGDLQTRSFSVIVRADGKNFYKYGPDYQRVIRLTRRQVFVDTRETLCAAIYIREDANDEKLLLSEFESNSPLVATEPFAPAIPGTENKPDVIKGMTFMDSRAFIGSRHPGFVDFYNLDKKWIHEIPLKGADPLSTAHDELQRLFKDGNEDKLSLVLELNRTSSRFQPEFIEVDFETEDEPLNHLVEWPLFIVHMVDKKKYEEICSKPESNSDNASKVDNHISAPSVPEEQEIVSNGSSASTETAPAQVEDTEMTDVTGNDEDDDDESSGILALQNEQLVFVKIFDSKKQQIEGVSCFVADREDNIKSALQRELPDTLSNIGEFKMFGEQRPRFGSGLAEMGKRLNDASSFQAEFEDFECIVIVEPIISQEQKDTVSREGGISEVEKFLAYLYVREYDPEMSQPNGQSNITLDYFGTSYYRGTISRGYAHGRGTEVTLGGEVYKGDFRMGLRSGKGHLTLQNNNTYHGDFADGKPHGIGKHVDSMTGNIYTGGFQRGKKRGRGTTEWKQAEEEAKVCRVCYDKEQDCAFYPCGHVCACYDCAKQAGICPMCHREGSRAFKLYFAC